MFIFTFKAIKKTKSSNSSLILPFLSDLSHALPPSPIDFVHCMLTRKVQIRTEQRRIKLIKISLTQQTITTTHKFSYFPFNNVVVYLI